MPQAGFGAVDLDKAPWSWLTGWEITSPGCYDLRVPFMFLHSVRDTAINGMIIWDELDCFDHFFCDAIFSRNFRLGFQGFVEKGVAISMSSPHVALIPCEWIMTRYD